MCVDDKLAPDLIECVTVVSVLVRLHLLKERIDLVVVGFQKFESIGLTGLD